MIYRSEDQKTAINFLGKPFFLTSGKHLIDTLANALKTQIMLKIIQAVTLTQNWDVMNA